MLSGVKMTWVDPHQFLKASLGYFLPGVDLISQGNYPMDFINIIFKIYIVSVSNEIIFLFYNSCSPFLYPLCSFRVVINPFEAFWHTCTLQWINFTTHVGYEQLGIPSYFNRQKKLKSQIRVFSYLFYQKLQTVYGL